MPKINREEYEILKGLDDEWKWIARDEDSKESTFFNELWLYEYKPKRMRLDWLGEGGATKWFGYDSLFQFVGDKDSEPYNIAELIEEYEQSLVEQIYESEKETFEKLAESEETEVKTKEELIEKWENYKNGARTVADSIAIEHADMFISDLNQLDEPEVLSQEWIEEHSNGASRSLYVWADDLKDLLVPKQEITKEQVEEYLQAMNMSAVDNELIYREGLENKEVIEKPTIPQFVADWLEEYKEDELTITAGTVIGNRRFPKDTKVAKWLNEDYVRNSEVFAQAWLAYPNIEVEEEQKYYALDTEDIPMLVRTHGVVNRANTHLSIHEKGRNTEHYQLTEQEIKDYDERYWPFAVKVEELEE